MDRGSHLGVSAFEKPSAMHRQDPDGTTYLMRGPASDIMAVSRPRLSHPDPWTAVSEPADGHRGYGHIRVAKRRSPYGRKHTHSNPLETVNHWRIRVNETQAGVFGDGTPIA